MLASKLFQEVVLAPMVIRGGVAAELSLTTTTTKDKTKTTIDLQLA
jgi:hypothetical protein